MRSSFTLLQFLLLAYIACFISTLCSAGPVRGGPENKPLANIAPKPPAKPLGRKKETPPPPPKTPEIERPPYHYRVKFVNFENKPNPMNPGTPQQDNEAEVRNAMLHMIPSLQAGSVSFSGSAAKVVIEGRVWLFFEVTGGELCPSDDQFKCYGCLAQGQKPSVNPELTRQYGAVVKVQVVLTSTAPKLDLFHLASYPKAILSPATHKIFTGIMGEFSDLFKDFYRPVGSLGQLQYKQFDHYQIQFLFV